MSVISHFPVRAGTYAEAYEAFQAGKITLCSAMLSTSRAPNAILLRARCLIRLAFFQEGIDSLVDLLHEDDLSDDHAAQAQVIRASILFYCRRMQEARGWESDALRRCRALKRADLECELLVGPSSAATYLGEESTEFIERAVALASCAQTQSFDSDYEFNCDFWLSRLYGHLTLLYNDRGDYKKKEEATLKGIEYFYRSGIRDDYYEAHQLANYAECGLSDKTSEIIEYVSSRLANFDRTDDMSEPLCRVYCHFAESVSMHGSFSEALSYFRVALEYATDQPLRLRIMIGRIHLLQNCGEGIAAREELEQAIAFNKTIDWISQRETYARQLLYLVSLATAVDVQEAKRLLSVYNSLEKNRVGRGIVPSYDPLIRAEEFCARALIARASRNFASAIVSYKDALAVLQVGDNEERLAAIALDLAELTHDDTYLECTRSWLRRRPKSPLASRIARYESDLITYSDALRAFEGADFGLCVRLLGTYSAPAPAILRGRAFLRLGLHQDAVETLESTLASGISRAQRAECLVLRAEAYAGCSDVAYFNRAFAEAADHLKSYPNANFEAELEFLSASTAMGNGDFTIAYEAILPEDAHTDTNTRKDSKSAEFTQLYWYARCKRIAALGKLIAGERAEALISFQDAFAAYDASRVIDTSFEAELVANFAALADVLNSADAEKILSDRMGRIAWTRQLESIKSLFPRKYLRH